MPNGVNDIELLQQMQGMPDANQQGLANLMAAIKKPQQDPEDAKKLEKQMAANQKQEMLEIKAKQTVQKAKANAALNLNPNNNDRTPAQKQDPIQMLMKRMAQGPSQESLNAQKESIERLQGLQQQYLAGSGGGGAAAALGKLADYIEGGDRHAALYKGAKQEDPATKAYKAAQIEQMIMKAQGNRGRVSETDILKVLRLQGTQEARERSRDLRKDKFGTGLIDKVNKDKIVQKADEAVGEAERILTLVDTNNPVAHGAIPTFMARAAGEVGNLSEADKKPFGGTKALLGRIDKGIYRRDG